MNTVDSRKLVGTRFGISISASNFKEDLRLGLEDDINRFTFHEARYILLEGGRLVLGHKWTPGGILDHLASRVDELRKYQLTPPDLSSNEAAITSLLAWPDASPQETATDAQEMISKNILRIEQIRPDGIDVETLVPDSDLGRYSRIRALTNMRRVMTGKTDVRLCFGGAANKPERRLPGVMEEVIFAIQARQSVYISSSLGGVSRVIADAILQRRLSDHDHSQFFTAPDTATLMELFSGSYPYPQDEGPSVSGDTPGSRWSALEFLQNVNLAQLALDAHLQTDEYINLLTTADVERALSLIATAVYRKRNAPTR